MHNGDRNIIVIFIKKHDNNVQLVPAKEQEKGTSGRHAI